MNFFSIIIHSCFGFRSYANLLDIPYKSTLKFLAQLVALLALIVAVAYLPGLIARIPEIAGFVGREFPKFDVRDGRVVLSPAAQAADANYANPRIAVDIPGMIPAAQTGGDEGPKPGATAATADIVIQRDAIVFREDAVNDFGAWLFYDRPFAWSRPDTDSDASPLTFKLPFGALPALPDGTFDGDYCTSYLWKLIPMGFLTAVVMVFLACLLQSHMFAAFSSMLERHLPARFTYAQLLNLATYAITPAAIIVTIYLALRLEDLNLPMIYLIAYGVFLIGSSNGCRPRSEEAPVDDSELY